jgi:hypothetical protein
MVLFHSPFWANQVQNENTEMFHEVLKEMNSHCLGRVLVNIPQNVGPYELFALLS